MKFCPKCGAQAIDAARFCRACGAPLPESATAAVTTPPVPVTPAPSPPPTVPPPVAKSASVPPSTPQTSVPIIGEEHEIPPPPPAKGTSVTWQKGKRGLVRRVGEVPPEVIVASATPPITPTSSTGPNVSTAGAAASPPPGGFAAGAAATTSFKNFVGAAESVALPPAPTAWKFREQTSAWADAVAERLRSAVASSNASLAATLTRIVRGAFMHRQIYRETAANPQLNLEALYVAGGIILAGFVGQWFTGLSMFYSGGSIGMFIRLAVIRIASWAAAVIAIQYAAKSLHQVNLPAAAWFRALVYAQTPTLLMIVPVVGLFSGIWSAVCSIAAIHDLEGRDTVSAVFIGVIGAVAATIGASVVTAVLRSFF